MIKIMMLSATPRYFERQAEWGDVIVVVYSKWNDFPLSPTLLPGEKGDCFDGRFH
jgi:hypothetical protein